NGNGSTISSVLRRELEKNLDRGEQSILFINRRGASNFVVCGECGSTYTCPNCSVSMKYHSANRRVMCHYCGHSESLPEKCPECGGILAFIGAGTQKVETELKELFPDVSILRMDTDTVSPANSHDKILSDFRKNAVPILVGTQMVTKGLDIENVTLVGVISADQSLYVNDYRAHERTFSMITQVIGRSGRGEKEGRAVIQTFTPENEVIRLASAQDYNGFYEREIELRKILRCPPIADIFTLTVFGQDEAAVLKGCGTVKASLVNYLGDDDDVRILGIAPAPVVKVNNKYRYNVTVCCSNTKRIREVIAHIVCRFSADKRYRGLSIYADINRMD
ncbi:MAG: primosomal protein N', partial [Oscillospiraceae bacterium]|nr:primosomal protein N' [Oscillospiraceae bacterium]